MSENVKKEPDIRFEGFVDDWEQRKLKELLSVPINDGPHTTPKLIEEGIPFISVDAIVDNKIDFDRKRGFISEITNEIYSRKYRPQFNDVYLVKSGSTVGKTAIVETTEQFNIWSPLAAMRTGEVSNPYFLYFLIQTDSVQNQVRGKSSNGTQPNLGMRELENFQIVVTCKKEQIEIGKFFKSLDHAITLHQKKLELLKKTKKGYLQKMFPKNGEIVPEIRFEGFSGEWEFKPLGDLVKISSGFTGDSLLDNGKYHLTRIETIAKGVIDESRVGYSNIQPSDRFLLNNGDILFSNINSLAHIGKTAIYDKGKELYHGINLLRLTPNNFMNPYFLYYQLNSEKKLRWAKSHANQAVNQASINQTELSKQIFMIPNTNEQDKIGMFLINLDHLIKYQQKRLDNLKYLKKSLLQKMFI